MALNSISLDLKPDGALAKASSQALRSKAGLSYTAHVTEEPDDIVEGLRGVFKRWVHPSEGAIQISVQQGQALEWTPKALSYTIRSVKAVASGSADATLMPGLAITDGKATLVIKIDFPGEAA